MALGLRSPSGRTAECEEGRHTNPDLHLHLFSSPLDNHLTIFGLDFGASFVFLIHQNRWRLHSFLYLGSCSIAAMRFIGAIHSVRCDIRKMVRRLKGSSALLSLTFPIKPSESDQNLPPRKKTNWFVFWWIGEHLLALNLSLSVCNVIMCARAVCVCDCAP